MADEDSDSLKDIFLDYLDTEGCDCCEGDSHSKIGARLAKLLGVTKEELQLRGMYSISKEMQE